MKPRSRLHAAAALLVTIAVSPGSVEALTVRSPVGAASRHGAGCSLLAIASEGAREHDCPVTLPTKTGADGQKPYFEKLHGAIVNGNGHLDGCRNESSQEHFVKEFVDELQCLYAMLLKDTCGGLPSQHSTRKEKWELACLSPDSDLLDAYDLMSGEEKKYFQRLKGEASEKQIYATYLELAGYKELVCIMMKTIDDECGGFSKPRLLPPSYWHGKKKDRATVAVVVA
eukprot:CAMPEP_0176100688 /NCGR_PEP_ID=MMETSP0120_2-20121206/50499_1 /TAXON_ID=160619 /ORGANISM="Kryptoperidinium foliaceum, Strain CCMP 1326" /LENGTH=227 /DNA_ID=CAMNT_0017434731 /DNA_START=9 /DNA_END=690 /DNA_ORIENTATION=+